jgi:hypothetical protein
MMVVWTYFLNGNGGSGYEAAVQVFDGSGDRPSLRGRC